MKKYYLIIIIIYLITIPLITIPLLLAKNNFVQNKTSCFYGYLKGDNVRMRKGPGLDYKSLGYLKYGTFVSTLKRTNYKSTVGKMVNYWYFCKLSSNQTGWIFGAFIEKGEFDAIKMRDKLPELEDIPEEVDVILNKSWLDCPPARRESNCSALLITKNYFLYKTATYQLISVNNIAVNKFSIKGKLKYSSQIVSRPLIIKKLIISYNKTKNILYLGKKSFYP